MKDFIKETKELQDQINGLIQQFQTKHPYLNITEGKEYKMKGEVDYGKAFNLQSQTS